MALQKCTLNLDHTRRELRPHGTLEFPCAGYLGHYTDRADGEISWHHHMEMELIYVEKGTLSVQIPGCRELIQEREAVFINSEVLHQGAGNPEVEIHSIVFSPDYIAGNADSILNKNYILPLIQDKKATICCFREPDFKRAAEAVEECYQLFVTEPSGYEFGVRELLTKIIWKVFETFRPDQSTKDRQDPDRERIQQMLDFIHNNYTEPVHVAEIAEAASIGEREALRCFQRAIKISPMQYLIRYRLMQGAISLRENMDMEVARIAGECGFDSPSNFTQAFRKYFNCTPREYRNQK